MENAADDINGSIDRLTQMRNQALVVFDGQANALMQTLRDEHTKWPKVAKHVQELKAALGQSQQKIDQVHAENEQMRKAVIHREGPLESKLRPLLKDISTLKSLVESGRVGDVGPILALIEKMDVTDFAFLSISIGAENGECSTKPSSRSDTSVTGESEKEATISTPPTTPLAPDTPTTPYIPTNLSMEVKSAHTSSFTPFRLEQPKALPQVAPQMMVKQPPQEYTPEPTVTFIRQETTQTGMKSEPADAQMITPSSSNRGGGSMWGATSNTLPYSSGRLATRSVTQHSSSNRAPLNMPPSSNKRPWDQSEDAAEKPKSKQHRTDDSQTKDIPKEKSHSRKIISDAKDKGSSSSKHGERSKF